MIQEDEGGHGGDVGDEAMIKLMFYLADDYDVKMTKIHYCDVCGDGNEDEDDLRG